MTRLSGLKRFIVATTFRLFELNSMEYTVWLSVRTLIQVALSFYGLIIYAIVLLPLLKFRKALFFTPFYTICFAMAFADIGQLIKTIIFCIRYPILASTNLFYLQLDGFLGRSLWYLSTCIELLIALERMVIVYCKPGSKLVINHTLRK